MICDHAGLLVTDQLTAVSSPVVQRHTPSNRKARVRGVWCEAFAPHTAIHKLKQKQNQNEEKHEKGRMKMRRKMKK